MSGRRRRSTMVLSPGDIVLDAARTSLSRLGRTIGLGLAVALGVATFVGVLSMSAAADAQVAERIAELRPELVTARPLTADDKPLELFDDEMTKRASQQPGSENTAIVHTWPDVTVRARWGTDEEQAQPAPLMGVEGDLLGATRSEVQGASFDGEVSRGDAHVALVGEGLADRLGLSDPDRQPVIWIDGVSFRVMGIVTDSEYLAATTDAVIIPRDRAVTAFGVTANESVLYVRVQRGLADPAAEALPLRLTPQRPEVWAMEVPRVPLDVAEGISGDLRNLSLAMAGLVMFIGVVAIGNAMMRSVYERMAEIGLRRAVGARGRHIVGLLVAEAALVGIVAGLMGIVAGLVVSFAVAARNDWPMVLSWWATAVAVPAGMTAGMLGGLLPGLAAVRVTPSQALRRE